MTERVRRDAVRARAALVVAVDVRGAQRYSMVLALAIIGVLLGAVTGYALLQYNQRDYLKSDGLVKSLQ